MKLKKIASLMLAGIMAVSMLAGCKSGTPDPKPNEGEEENTASGYSAMLGEKAAKDLMKADLDKVFTFADNADDQKALDKLAVGISEEKMQEWIVGNDLTVLHTKYYGSFKKDTGLDRDSLSNGTKIFAYEDSLTKKVGEVWVANGEISLDYVLDKIYETYKSQITSVPADGTVNNFDVDYDYTVSVSVVNKAVKSSSIFNGSVNLIAVTITRTSELV